MFLLTVMFPRNLASHVKNEVQKGVRNKADDYFAKSKLSQNMTKFE